MTSRIKDPALAAQITDETLGFKVNINTKEIDSVDMNPATGLSNVTAARLVLYFWFKW